MSKILLYTQTYDTNREAIFYFKNKDSNIKYFIEFFDSILSFHNSTQDFVDLILKQYNHPYKAYTIMNGISYPQTFKKIINYACANDYKK